MPFSSAQSSQLFFAWRSTPDAKWTNLNPDLIEYPRQFRIADEERLNEFRAGQIQLTLKEDRQTYTLSGGDEIGVFAGPPSTNATPLWAGTIDPSEIRRNEITHRLTFRVLQHGSLLNTIYAGLPDWTLSDSGELVLDSSKNYRYKGTADQYKRQFNSDGFQGNEIKQANSEVFYTPSARDALTDSLYRSKFEQKCYHFHTAQRELGGVEYPFPNTDDNTDNTVWTGQFEQHYRPDFAVDPSHWEDYQTGVTWDYGSYIRNKEPQHPFRRFAIADLIQNLVNQFNQTARFPLQFDPATDCVVVSPRIETEIEILKRQPNVAFLDIVRGKSSALNPDLVFVIVNYKDPQPQPRQEMTFSLFVIENETEAIPLIENGRGWRSNCWTAFADGMRFGRANAVAYPDFMFLYSLTLSEGEVPRHFLVHSYNIALETLSISGPFSTAIWEDLADYPDTHILNRSAYFTNSTGGAIVRVPVTNVLYPPEMPPEFVVDSEGRTYRTDKQNGLTVSGALFDRVAVDAEDTKLSALISDLAKLTHSRWFVTPDRRLKFLSRQLTSTTHPVASTSLRRPFETFTRSFEKEPAPRISSALVLPDNFRTAHTRWFEDNVQPTSTLGGKISVTRTDLPTVYLTDEIQLTNEPNIGSPAAVKSIDIVGDNQLDITTEQVVTL